MPGGKIVHNVLCLPARLDLGFTLIGAHYDSTSQLPAQLAPGADDNASGVAAVLETARLFSASKLRRGVGFAAFVGEEQGLLGSQTVAALAAEEKWALDVYVNLDMVGHVDPIRPTNIMVEYDQGNSAGLNDAAAKAFGLQMAQHAADYTKLNVEHTDIWSSDYMPFEARGFPCIGLYDGAADAPFYHTIDDTVTNVNIPRLAEVCAMLCAFVGTTAVLET
jgi:Zn-dependent M28 family amino/carboxypeptidase